MYPGVTELGSALVLMARHKGSCAYQLAMARPGRACDGPVAMAMAEPQRSISAASAICMGAMALNSTRKKKVAGAEVRGGRRCRRLRRLQAGSRRSVLAALGALGSGNSEPRRPGPGRGLGSEANNGSAADSPGYLCPDP